MRIVGTKYCGHDSALCLLDTEKKTIFAMGTERITRIKHDVMDVSPVLDAYPLGSVDIVCHSLSDFALKSEEGELRAQMTHNKDIEKAIRSIIKPTYIKDLNISRSEKNKLIRKSLFTNFSAVKTYYSSKFKRAFTKNNKENNRKVFTDYIKKNFNNRDLFPEKIYFFDHHLCHAIPSYYLSPYYGEKAIALTVDGQGDGFFSKLYIFDEEAKYKSLGSSKASPLGGQGGRYLSVGRIYEHFTEAMDLRVGSDEGKVEAIFAFLVAWQLILL